MPLRAYLAGLAALFVVAAGAAVVYGRVHAREDAERAAEADARFAARLAAKEIGNGVALIRSTVAGAAANPGTAKAYASPEDCGLTFGGTDAYTTGHLDLVRADGRVACSSMERATAQDYARAPWREQALTQPLLLAPAADPRTNQRVVLATAPVKDLGFVLAAFGLDEVGASLKRSYGGPRGLEFLLTSGATRLAGAPLTGRLTAGARVPQTGWTVQAGADREQALAATDELNRRELAIILAGLVLFLAATWFVHRRVARPLASRLGELGAAYRVVFDGSPLPIYVHDTETGRILEANAAAVHATGYSHEELLNTTFETIAVADGLHLRKDGTTIEVKVASHPIDFLGRPASVTIAEDITESERLRQQLQQSQRLESLGQLAGGVAHDFNNLLAVILGYASFIERRAEPESKDARDVKQILEAAERASRLTRQLLAFARREVVRPTVLDLTGVVLEMERMLRRTLGEHVLLQTTLAPDLWPVLADHGQIEQVLINLAVNARDAMPEGGTLTLDTENIQIDAAYASTKPGLEPGRYVRLRVSDTGTGMDAATAARAFEPFFTTKPKGKGTGLGLATIHGIVTQAGGHVQIYSEPGLGTTFTVLLPATDAPVPEPRPAPQATHSGGGETILVVEDEPAMLEVTRRILEEHGYRVLTAGSGLDAIRIANEHDGPVDLLLTDVVMPQMLGKEVAERVTAARPETQVLFMSGYAQTVIAPMGDLADGREIVDKPFTEAALLERLRALLASRAAP